LTGAFLALLVRDLRVAVRVGGGGLVACLFFLCVVTVVPFGVGPDLRLLARIGPALLWVGALLATLLSLDRLFQADHEDGSLDLLRLSGLPLELAVLAKAAAQWLTTGLPLALLSPLLGIMLNVPPSAGLWVALTLLVGTPALSLTGAVGAALTVSLRRGGALLPVLVLPFAVPVLIFGTLAAQGAIGGTGARAPLLILAALSLASAVIGPIAAAAALRGAE